MVQNGLIVLVPNRQLDCCNGLHDTDLSAMVQNDIIVHFLDGYMDWCPGVHDTGLAITARLVICWLYWDLTPP